MNFVIVFALALVAFAVAIPVENKPIEVIRSQFEQSPEGGYVFGFETENGIVRDEQGEIKEALDEENKPHSVVVVRGVYTVPGEDGKPETVNYYADETGYHAEGNSIPKAASL